MKRVSLALILALQTAWAVPGLERTWNSMHPGAEVSCVTCHHRNYGTLPTNDNVTDLGRKNYAEIIAKRTAGIPDLKPFALLEQVDLVVMGDSRTDLETNRIIVNQICADGPKAVIHTGDMVANGESAKQWSAIVPIFDCLLQNKNLYPACGNHEASFCTNNVIRTTLKNTQAYYTFDFQGYTFISLDSNNITGAEIQWLKALPVGKKYIPYFHHPAYPLLAGHGPDLKVKSTFIPEFKRLGVKLVFTGHNHGYDRNLVDGITYITSGGAGAPLYPCGKVSGPNQVCVSDYHYVRCSVTPNSFTCQAKLIDGSTVDSVSVNF